MRLNKLTYCSLFVVLMAFQQSYAIESIDIHVFQEAFANGDIKVITDNEPYLDEDYDIKPSDYITHPEKYQQVHFQLKDRPSQSIQDIDLYHHSYIYLIQELSNDDYSSSSFLYNLDKKLK